MISVFNNDMVYLQLYCLYIPADNLLESHNLAQLIKTHMYI